MRFTRKVSLVELDLRGYRKALDDHMKEQTREAGRSWLQTVLLIIPTWSRASRATFEALADAVGFNVTYGPQRSREDRLTLGLQTGRGGTDFKTKNQYYFFYETDLQYLAYNEFNRVIVGEAPNVFAGLLTSTPFKFQEAGAADFASFAKNVLLPSPIDFIKPRALP